MAVERAGWQYYVLTCLSAEAVEVWLCCPALHIIELSLVNNLQYMLPCVALRI